MQALHGDSIISWAASAVASAPSAMCVYEQTNPDDEPRHPNLPRLLGALVDVPVAAAEPPEPVPAIAILSNQEVALRLLFSNHRRGRNRLRAELDEYPMHEDALVCLQRLDPRNVHQVRRPRRARPFLHELHFISRERGDGRKEKLHVLVLQLPHLLEGLKQERWFAVGNRHHCALRLLAAIEKEQFLR